MHLDLGAWLNIISTIAIVGALIFTGLQVRAANLARREQLGHKPAHQRHARWRE